MKKLNQLLKSKEHYGILLIRLVTAWRLIAGVWSYAVGAKPMREVEDFFESLNMPLPLLSATISVYAQFICGFLFIVGLFVRPAAIVMIINFSIAIIAAHLHDPIVKSFSAWALLAMAACLLFTGGDKLSIDNRLKTQTTK